jgi:hypothetical protein
MGDDLLPLGKQKLSTGLIQMLERKSCGPADLFPRALRRWWVLDVGLALFVFISLAALQPRMPDGDGLAHASRAIYEGFLEGMEAKHLTYAAVLHSVYVPLRVLNLHSYAISALSMTSHLAAVGIFLLLARTIYPLFIKDHLIASLSALGTVASFGIMSRAVTIETYSLALLTDVALIAVCLKGNLDQWRITVAAGLLFVLAVGFHVTNVLLAPCVLALLVIRGQRSTVMSRLVWFGGTVIAGMSILLGLFLAGKHAGAQPLDWAQIFPNADVQPSLGLLGHLGRAAYGFARAIAWVPPLPELSMGFATGYGLAMVVGLLVVLYLFSAGLWQRRARYRPVWIILALVIVPFTAIGIYYFPSDPERWLFLTPAVWLVIGLIWSEYRPAPGILLTRTKSLMLLGIIVASLGLYNGLYKLLPEAQHNRELVGLKELAKVTSASDLVITPTVITSDINEFFLQKPLDCDNLTFTGLVDKYGGNRADLQSYLRAQITEKLQHGAPVYVHRVINEGHVAAKGYPWAHFTEFNYSPETFIDVLLEFNPTIVIAPSASRTGTFRLYLPTA